MLYCYWFTRVC
uniref:Uncharacterized protein n=1 Tax=Romanomermis culicivorax TaxID=13658 RepID=A0A915IMB4_ROMCU